MTTNSTVWTTSFHGAPPDVLRIATRGLAIVAAVIIICFFLVGLLRWARRKSPKRQACWCMRLAILTLLLGCTGVAWHMHKALTLWEAMGSAVFPIIAHVLAEEAMSLTLILGVAFLGVLLSTVLDRSALPVNPPQQAGPDRKT